MLNFLICIPLSTTAFLKVMNGLPDIFESRTEVVNYTTIIKRRKVSQVC